MAKRPASICAVVTAHNVEECLGECLASLAAQTFSDFEAIVVEDGSSDETARIANEFALQDDRFRVVHTSNLGAAGARNHGLALVDSPYFMLLDGDDVFLPTMLEALHGQAIRCEADVVVCDIVQFDHNSGERTAAPWALKESQLPNLAETPSFSWRDVPGNVFAAFMGWPWDKLYRTAFARSAGLSFPDDLSNSEDMLFLPGHNPGAAHRRSQRSAHRAPHRPRRVGVQLAHARPFRLLRRAVPHEALFAGAARRRMAKPSPALPQLGARLDAVEY